MLLLFSRLLLLEKTFQNSTKLQIVRRECSLNCQTTHRSDMLTDYGWLHNYNDEPCTLSPALHHMLGIRSLQVPGCTELEAWLQTSSMKWRKKNKASNLMSFSVNKAAFVTSRSSHSLPRKTMLVEQAGGARSGTLRKTFQAACVMNLMLWQQSELEVRHFFWHRRTLYPIVLIHP